MNKTKMYTLSAFFPMVLLILTIITGNVILSNATLIIISVLMALSYVGVIFCKKEIREKYLENEKESKGFIETMMGISLISGISEIVMTFALGWSVIGFMLLVLAVLVFNTQNKALEASKCGQ